ncbi:transposase [Streptomyces sp. NPDC002540]
MQRSYPTSAGLNIMSAIASRGALWFTVFTGRFTAKVFTSFLDRLARQARRKVHVIVDRHPVPCSKAVRAWLEANADRVELHLNPDTAPNSTPTRSSTPTSNATSTPHGPARRTISPTRPAAPSTAASVSPTSSATTSTPATSATQSSAPDLTLRAGRARPRPARTGDRNAGSNTVADHLTVLTDALARIPGSSAAKLLIGVDGAGATHGLHEHLIGLNTHRRAVRFTTGWTITDADEQAIACLPETAWEVSLNQDGTLQEDYGVAELSGMSAREGWSKGLRLIVRWVKPSSHHLKDLTDFEKKTGFKCSVIATNICKMTRIPGSHQAQWLDALHWHHAVVEDRVRTNKAMGLHNLPSKSFTTNQGWMLAANLVADLDAWLRLLALHDQDELADAEPDTMRFRIHHLPDRLAAHARHRHLRLALDWPWATAFVLAGQRLAQLPAVT